MDIILALTKLASRKPRITWKVRVLRWFKLMISLTLAAQVHSMQWCSSKSMRSLPLIAPNGPDALMRLNNCYRNPRTLPITMRTPLPKLFPCRLAPSYSATAWLCITLHFRCLAARWFRYVAQLCPLTALCALPPCEVEGKVARDRLAVRRSVCVIRRVAKP